MRPSPSDKRRGWHWSDYWRSGRTDVMTVQTAGGPVAFDTQPIWAAWFNEFEDGAALLDLATGNGQVAGYASGAAAAAGKSFAVTGVDYADVAAASARAPAGCQLLGGVALEQLPFAAAALFTGLYRRPGSFQLHVTQPLLHGGQVAGDCHSHRGAVARALRALWGQTSFGQPHQFDVRTATVQPRANVRLVGGQRLMKRIHARQAAIRWFTGEDDSEDGAQAEHVAALVELVNLAAGLLGSHVSRRAQHFAHLCLLGEQGA